MSSEIEDGTEHMFRPGSLPLLALLRPQAFQSSLKDFEEIVVNIRSPMFHCFSISKIRSRPRENQVLLFATLQIETLKY
ncbi:hypothetical protein LXL04_034487 [Taraxacum kok-saghyz]